MAPALATAQSTWNDPAATTVNITTTATPNNTFVSDVALRDGDVVRMGSTISAIPVGLNDWTNYYVVGVGSVPSTTIKLSGSPGGTALVAPTASDGGVLTGGPQATTLAAYWSDASNWTGGVPNAIDATATISANANTRGIVLNRNTTVGTLNFSGTGGSTNLLSTITGLTGPFAKLTFATSAGTPTVTVSGGQTLYFNDAKPAAGGAVNNNGRLVIAGNQGLLIDNQNAIGALPGTLNATAAVSGVAQAVNASPGAVRFGFGTDWSGLTGDLTLARGSFAMQGGASSTGIGALPLANRVVLGTGANQAQIEVNANTSLLHIRGLDGNASSSIVNNADGGGPALSFGSFSLPGDVYTFNGNIGAAISANPNGANPGNLRLIKSGASTQRLLGSNTFYNATSVIVNSGRVDLGETGTIGTRGLVMTTAAGANVAGTASDGMAFGNGGAGTTQMFFRNGELRIAAVSANTRTQSVNGALRFGNDSAIGNNYSRQSSGLSTITLDASAAGSQQLLLQAASVQNRNLNSAGADANANGATQLFRGTNLGSAAGPGVASVRFFTAPTIAVNGYLNSLAGAAGSVLGTPTAPVFKGALADRSATGTGEGFATYDPAVGVRLLDATTEQNTAGYPVANSNDNIRLNLAGASPAAIAGVTTNTLQLDNTNGANTASTVTITGVGFNPSNGLLFSGNQPISLVPGGAGDQLTGTAATDGEDVVIHSINTSPAGITIALPISNPGLAAGRRGWVTYNGPGNITQTGAVSLGVTDGGIAFNGTGTTTLASAITLGGNPSFFAVNQGTVKLGSGISFTGANRPAVWVAAGATFDLNGQAGLTFDSLGSLVGQQAASPYQTSGGTVTNSSATTVDLTLATGGANATQASFAGTITGNLNLVVARTPTNTSQSLFGTNTYTGSTTVKSGATLIVGRYGSLPSTTNVILGEAATAGTLTVGDNGGTINGAVDQEIAGLVTAGTSTTNAVTGGNGNVSTLTVNYTNTVTPNVYSGVLGLSSGVGNANNLRLRKTGAGTLELTGTPANGYTGGTEIVGGKLRISADNKIGGLAGASTLGPTSPFSAIPNNIVLNGGTLETGATLTFNSNRGIGLGPQAGGAGGGGTISVDSGTTLTYGGVIAAAGHTGASTLTKAGAGRLVLSGASTYAGATSVNEGTLELNGSLGATAVNVQTAGTLAGAGTIGGALTVGSGGTLSPGSSAGTFTVNSTVGLGAGSTSLFEIGGTTAGQFDKLIATGALSAGGTFAVSLINAFAPALNDTFDLLDFASASGSFTTLTLPALGPGLQWDSSNLLSTGVLSVAALAVNNANFNGDAFVDGLDFLAWQRGFGTGPGALLSDGDANGSGTVDATDLGIWQSQFVSAAVPVSGAVPEPASAALVAAAAIGLAFASRRRAGIQS